MEMLINDAREHIADGVVYDPGMGQKKEDGVITSVGEVVVFVRYAGDNASKATRAGDLTLLSPCADCEASRHG
jgi:hypothetical protein